MPEVVHIDGNLARIYDQGQLDAMANTIDLTNSAWIGLERDANENNKWRYDKKEVDSTVTPWAANQSHTAGGDGALLRHDGILNADTNSLHPFMCQFSENTLGNSQFTGGKPFAVSNPLLDHGMQDNIQDCGIMCHDDRSCQSYAYNSASKECKLYWLSAQELTLINDPSSKFFSRRNTDPSCLAESDCLLDAPKLLIIGGISRSSIEVFYPQDTSKNRIMTNFDSTRYGTAAVQIGSKVLIVGGKEITGSGTNPLNTVYLLDLKTNTLSPAASLNQARSSHGAVLFDGKVIVCGGWYGSSGLDSCEQYSNDQWSAFPKMSRLRKEAQIVAASGKLFMIGGDDTDNINILDVDCFDPGTNSWALTAAPLPTGYSRYGLTVLEDEIYICGGTSTVKTCHKYNVENDEWFVVASLEGTHGTNTMFHYLVAMHGKLYAFAGTVAEVYDKQNDQWEVLPMALIEARTYSVAISVTF